MINTIPAQVILDSELISVGDARLLHRLIESNTQLTAAEILCLDLPARNRVDALLRHEFLEEGQLRELACDFVERALHIYEVRSPSDDRPRKCVEVARLRLKGAASSEELQAVVTQAIRAVWRFEGTKFDGAFQAGFAATFLNCEDAGEAARLAAFHTQIAAHREIWESRKSNFQLMVKKEKEATWQLKHIVEKISMGFI